MADILTTPRREINWGQLGQALAQPFAQQQNLYQSLIPLLFRAQLEQQDPLRQAQASYYKDRINAEKITDTIKRSAWEKYQMGERSPQILKTLGMWVSPMEEIMAQNLGFYNPQGGVPNAIPNAPSEIPTGISKEDWSKLTPVGKIIFMQSRKR